MPVGREWRRKPLCTLDPELNEPLRADLTRQQETLALIASANFASRAVLEATGSVPTNECTEGLPGARCALIDLRGSGITGLECQDILERVNITANCSVVSFEDKSLNIASGIVGSPAVTTRGFGEAEMLETGELILEALANRDDEWTLPGIRAEVLELLERFPLYEFL